MSSREAGSNASLMGMQPRHRQDSEVDECSVHIRRHANRFGEHRTASRSPTGPVRLKLALRLNIVAAVERGISLMR